ncbi:MAG: GNAT family N-acetyltransferase [Clostridium sp.]
MNIRKMKCEDYTNVYNLWMACAGMGLNNLDDSQEGITKFLQRNSDTCFVATETDIIVGVILVGSDGRRGYIYHTAVHPNYRKKGIAKKLVKKSLEALEEIGINKVALVVFKHNENGNKFWGKLGFTERKDLVYRNKAIIEMVRIDT